MKHKLFVFLRSTLLLLLFTFPAEAAELPLVDKLDVSQGAIHIPKQGVVQQNGQYYSFSMTKGLTLTGKTDAYGVTVEYGVGYNETLPLFFDNLYIDTRQVDDCAFSVLEGASVRITLMDGTDNTLLSADYYAGLQAQNQGGKSGQVRIGGNGSLTAIGGKGASGIGGAQNVTHWNGTGGKITIESGTIKATGGSEGAGIGGGYKGDGGDITISGGDVQAFGGDLAAGIGGGHYGLKGNLNLTANNIQTTPGSGADAIGNGADYQEKVAAETVLEVNRSSGDPKPTPIPSPEPTPTPTPLADEPKAPSTSSLFFFGGALLILVLALGFGIYFLQKKRKAHDSES